MSLYKLFYRTRYEKAAFIARVFGKYFREGGKVLDVGGGRGYLKGFIKNSYTCVDIIDEPGIFRVNLEKERLPFPDDEFDIVICTDVLEHLDNLHEVFDEIVRVARRYIIVSLPNMFSLGFRLQILFGKDNIKFYGLPPKRPKDRHKWFFSYNQARSFIHQMAREKNLVILEEFPYFNRSKLLRTELFWPLKIRFPNLFAQTYWVLLKKGKQ
jgi:ubiquinone/menaquinone biosynthesis C-methylase UbiE